MKHKTIALIAVFMIVVFSVTVIVYPLLFNPDNKVAPTTAPMPMEAPAQ